MGIYRKVFALTICAVILSCSCAYAADYHYATTNMTWAEFYAGETEQTSSALESAGLDAVSTATVRFTNRFNATVSSTSDSGSTYTGLKAVQVRMTDDVYNAITDKSRYTFVNEVFTEYKDVYADGSFGKMITETVSANASVRLASGRSVNHGDYMLALSGLDLASLGLKFGEGSSFDYYLGAVIETQSGKKYGLRPLYNIWVNTSQLGFSVKDFTERNGTVLASKYTSDLAGQTVTRITFLLKNQPDPYITCSAYVKGSTTATAEPVYETGFTAFEVVSGVVTATLRVNNAPSDANYDSIVSVSYDDPKGHHGWSTLPADSYTYSNGILTITGDIASKTHTYNIVLEDSNNRYIDIGTSFKTFTTDATSLIISGDNLGGVNFLITPEGCVSSVDAELESGNFVNATDYTSPDSNRIVSLSGLQNQVEGSGFSFDIALNNLPSGKTGVVGFGKIFYLTPNNCGGNYASIYSAISQLEEYPSGFRLVEGDMFSDMGFSVMSIQNGNTVDLTRYVGAGAMIISESQIMIYYGLMLADANTNEIREGGTYAFSPEGETLVSDGSRDGHLRFAMYFALSDDDPTPAPTPTPTPSNNPGSPGGGCDAFSLSSAGLILALAFMKLRRR